VASFTEVNQMTGWHKPDRALRAPAVGNAMFQGFCRAFFACYCPLTVEGLDHLPNEPFLLCSNHASHIDSAVLMTASGRSFRSFALLGASDYFFHSRTVRWSVSPLMNVIPIERQPGPKSLATSLEECRRFLEETGGGLILYPEGTRSPDGEMRTFKTGAALFASRLAIPVVPAYIEGSHRILSKGRSMPRPRPLTVRFGRALAFAAPSTSGESLRDRRHVFVEELCRSIRLLNLGDRTPEFAGEVQKRDNIKGLSRKISPQ
jgi:1-acyl-sn-glycerol-3-phosphate acyltransferase